MQGVFTLFLAFNVCIYRQSKVKSGGSMRGMYKLLLTVTGRKSGKGYTIPLGRLDHREEDFALREITLTIGLPPAWAA